MLQHDSSDDCLKREYSVYSHNNKFTEESFPHGRCINKRLSNKDEKGRKYDHKIKLTRYIRRINILDEGNMPSGKVYDGWRVKVSTV